jgi:hypothetical protein
MYKSYSDLTDQEKEVLKTHRRQQVIELLTGKKIDLKFCTSDYQYNEDIRKGNPGLDDMTLQEFLLNNCKLDFVTGICALDTIEAMITADIDNDNNCSVEFSDDWK